MWSQQHHTGLWPEYSSEILNYLCWVHNPNLGGSSSRDQVLTSWSGGGNSTRLVGLTHPCSWPPPSSASGKLWVWSCESWTCTQGGNGTDAQSGCRLWARPSSLLHGCYLCFSPWASHSSTFSRRRGRFSERGACGQGVAQSSLNWGLPGFQPELFLPHLFLPLETTCHPLPSPPARRNRGVFSLQTDRQPTNVNPHISKEPGWCSPTLSSWRPRAFYRRCTAQILPWWLGRHCAEMPNLSLRKWPLVDLDCPVLLVSPTHYHYGHCLACSLREAQGNTWKPLTCPSVRGITVIPAQQMRKWRCGQGKSFVPRDTNGAMWLKDPDSSWFLSRPLATEPSQPSLGPAALKSQALASTKFWALLHALILSEVPDPGPEWLES